MHAFLDAMKAFMKLRWWWQGAFSRAFFSSLKMTSKNAGRSKGTVLWGTSNGRGTEDVVLWGAEKPSKTTEGRLWKSSFRCRQALASLTWWMLFSIALLKAGYMAREQHVGLVSPTLQLREVCQQIQKQSLMMRLCWNRRDSVRPLIKTYLQH